MKKTLALLLSVLMVLAIVAACGTTTTGTESAAPATTEEATATEAPAETAETTEPATEAVDMTGIGGFAVNPLYFYTNMYCLKEGIENVEYTSFGYYFFMHATGTDVIDACIASEPETIDPGTISSVDGSTYTQHQFEGLMKYIGTGAAVADDPSVINTKTDYGMATSYEVSDDMMTYTFHLREGALWSDGEPVKAGDFVYSWQRIVDPALASDYGFILDGIVVNAAAIQAGEMDKSELGIVALDDATLQISLEAPCPYFLELCAFASLMPLREDIVETYGTEWTNPGNIVTNGPYIITEWVHDSYISLSKNANYYDVANLGPDSIVYHLSDSETAILSAYEAGDYDFIDNFPADRIADLQASGDCFINPYVGTYYLYINCDNVPDWRVRAAICLVTDRENIVENVTQGGQVPATGLVASGIGDSTGANFAETNAAEIAPMWKWLQANYADGLGLDLNDYEDRCELAVTLLDEAVAAGYDTNTTIYYCYNTSETHQDIAEAVQNDVNTILGLQLELTNQDWNVYTNGLAEGDFGLARLGWIADYNDPITYIELFANGNSYNYSEWVCDEYTNLVTEAKTLPAGAERDALLYEAEDTLFSGECK